MKIHKLRFTNQAAWEALKATFTDDEGAITDARIYTYAIPYHTGILPNPTEYNEQGEPLPPTFKDGYHVDVMTTETIQEWKPYTVTGASHWAHSFGYGEVVTQEDFIERPNDSWLKADIQAWLTQNEITWTTSMTKAQLLQLVP